MYHARPSLAQQQRIGQKQQEQQKTNKTFSKQQAMGTRIRHRSVPTGWLA